MLSRRGRAVLPAVVTDRVRPGNCFVSFYWNNVFGDDLAINAVTNDAVDPIYYQPEFKCCAVAMMLVSAPIQTNTLTGAISEVRADVNVGAVMGSVNEEQKIMKIDALAKLLGIEAASTVKLEDQEQRYLSGYVVGLRSVDFSQRGEVPTLPMSAPTDKAKRLWVEGFLAGLFSRTYVSAIGDFTLTASAGYQAKSDKRHLNDGAC